MMKRFLFYGTLGWCLEVFWTGLGSFLKGDIRLSSQTYIWMFPIYGLAVFLEPIHDKIRNWSVILRGGIYTIIIFSIEFFTGYMLKLLLGVCPWKYFDDLSVQGIITLYFIPVWFTAGFLFEFVHRTLDRAHIFFDPF